MQYVRRKALRLYISLVKQVMHHGWHASVVNQVMHHAWHASVAFYGRDGWNLSFSHLEGLVIMYSEMV